MKNKFLALGLSLLSLGFGFAPGSSAAKLKADEEKIISEIRTQTIKEQDNSDRKNKITKIKRNILKAQAQIKELEKAKSGLENKLSVALKFVEVYHYAGFYGVNHEYKLLLSKIKKLRSKISLKKSEIKSLKSEIKKLKQQLTIQIQLEEIGC